MEYIYREGIKSRIYNPAAYEYLKAALPLDEANVLYKKMISSQQELGIQPEDKLPFIAGHLAAYPFFDISEEGRLMATRVQNFDWLSHIGDPCDADDVVSCHSWKQARIGILSEAFGVYRHTIIERIWQSIPATIQIPLFGELNSAISEIIPLSIFDPLRAKLKIPERYVDSVVLEVRNIIRFSIHEEHWSRIVNIRDMNYRRLYNWLAGGRLPCGYIGKQGIGKICVF